MRLFHICTIANNLSQYDEMRDSFAQAGFNKNNSSFTLFDNSKDNLHDPYKSYNQVKIETIEPFIIFCHQDILLNNGHNFEKLRNTLAELEKVDPAWAVAGNAGFNKDYNFVARIIDPNNSPNWKGNFPQKVVSLDENFLIVKTNSAAWFSEQLSGFHLYGTDICINAITNKHSCYVIDFNLTHLSGGNIDDSFRIGLENFAQYWNRQLDFCYVKTPTARLLPLSKYQSLRDFGNRKKFFKQLETRKWLRAVVSPYALNSMPVVRAIVFYALSLCASLIIKFRSLLRNSTEIYNEYLEYIKSKYTSSNKMLTEAQKETKSGRTERINSVKTQRDVDEILDENRKHYERIGKI